MQVDGTGSPWPSSRWSVEWSRQSDHGGVSLERAVRSSFLLSATSCRNSCNRTSWQDNQGNGRRRDVEGALADHGSTRHLDTWSHDGGSRRPWMTQNARVETPRRRCSADDDVAVRLCGRPLLHFSRTCARFLLFKRSCR